jgi:hypothetical protein
VLLALQVLLVPPVQPERQVRLVPLVLRGLLVKLAQWVHRVLLVLMVRQALWVHRVLLARMALMVLMVQMA